jgi:hypothetical protein
MFDAELLGLEDEFKIALPVVAAAAGAESNGDFHGQWVSP